MFNPDKNKIYKISYYINNVEYFSFSKLAGKNIFRDVITGKLYKFQDVANVIYTEVDPNLIKYFSKLYKKQKNINVFLSTNYTDENLFLYINILRFFDLKPKDFIKNNKNINIKNKIINKCKGYLKRYFNIDELENYISNLNKLDDICSILSYKPYEFMVNKYYNKLFWVDKFLSCNHFKNELFELKKEIFIISDILNLNVNEYVLNKNKYILKIKENRNILLKKLEDEYKNQLKIALRDKIEKSKNTLLEEKNTLKPLVMMIYYLKYRLYPILY
jgi:hypothetical protein